MKNRILKGVRVVNISAVPALYFFRPKVQEAVQAEIWKDLRQGKKLKVPAGCQGIYGQSSRLAAFKRRIKKVFKRGR